MFLMYNIINSIRTFEQPRASSLSTSNVTKWTNTCIIHIMKMGIENVKKAKRKTCVALNNENHFQNKGEHFQNPILTVFTCFTSTDDFRFLFNYISSYEIQKNLKRMNYKIFGVPMKIKFSYFLVHCYWYLRSLWYYNRLMYAVGHETVYLLFYALWNERSHFRYSSGLFRYCLLDKCTFNILNTRSIYSCIKAILIVFLFICIFILGCILVLCSFYL